MMSSMMSDMIVSLSVKYNFSAEEAQRYVNMEVGVGSGSVGRVVKEKVVKEKVVKDKVVKDKVVKDKVVVERCSFPLPFDGKEDVMNCSALKKCEGLYTQCVQKKSVDTWCKGCASQIAKNDGKPLYGSIVDRLAVDIMEYVDPKGVKVTAFKKVMKKLKISDSEIESECVRLGINILDIHMKDEEESEKKKGRPKKVSKVLEIEGESSDLFAELVANAEPEVEFSQDTSSESSEKSSRIEMSIEDKQSKQVEKETAKVEKAAKAAAEKAAKAAKLEEEKAAKAAKAAAEKEEKAAKAAKLEEEKAAKAAKVVAKPAEKAVAKPTEKAVAKPTAKAAEKKKDDSEPDVVKRFEFEGKKYLKSKNTGVIYNMDQDVVGVWNDKLQKIDFKEVDSEEEEEEYDEENDV